MDCCRAGWTVVSVPGITVVFVLGVSPDHRLGRLCTKKNAMP